MRLKPRFIFLFIVFLSVATIVLSWNGNYEGGDIAGARRSFLGQNPIDLWGGFSGFFYGNIPNFLLPWGLWLLVLQITCSASGLILISKHILLRNTIQYIFFLVLSYLILSFAGYLTRDSTMASFYIFGLGLICASNQFLKTSDKALFFLGTFFIILAVAFRPWLFFATLLPVIFYRRNKLEKLIFAIILIILPFGIDKLMYVTTDYKKVYPELQVIISDVASISCLSSNNTIRKNGTDLLNKFSKTLYSNGEICNDFRINTWQSVGSWSLKPSEIGLAASKDANSQYSKILISSNMTVSNYTEIRNSWLSIIAKYPKDYLQVKLIHANQVIFSGDTFGLRILNADAVKNYFSGLFYILFDIVISLHLLSPAMTFLIGFLIIIFKLRNKSVETLFKTKEIILSFSFLFCWILATSIAYIGDNGRYTYTSSFIFYILICLGINKIETASTVKLIHKEIRGKNN